MSGSLRERCPVLFFQRRRPVSAAVLSERCTVASDCEPSGSARKVASFAVPVRKLRGVRCFACAVRKRRVVSVSFPCRQATHRFAGFRRFGYIFRIRWQDVPVDEAARVPYGEGVACGRSRRITGSAEREDCRKFRQHPSGAFFRRDNSCSNRDRSYRRGGRRGCRIRRTERGCGS